MPEPLPWESLAGLRGPAERCTCSDDQLALVGCDCDANQNLPVRCGIRECGRFLRTNDEIYEGVCASCLDWHRRVQEIEDDHHNEGAHSWWQLGVF